MAVGDSNLFFNRDTKVYAVQATETAKFNVWELPVLAGYSFSQATNSSQITLNEMSDATGKSRRGQRSFNDSLAPAEWSFDMYARPTLATVVRSPEEILWASLLAESNFTPAANVAAGLTLSGGSYSGTTVTLTFTTAATTNTYFKVGDYITVSGSTATTNAPNGTFQVTATTLTTVTYVVPNAPTGALVVTGAKIQSATVVSTATETDFLATSSNKTRLATFDLYFILGANKWNSISGTTPHKYDVSEETTIYKITGCCVNEATLNFEIDGIATISWAGMGQTISELTSVDFTASATYNTLINNGVSSTSNMIRNRLTALNAYSGITSDSSTNLTTTGVTIANGIATATYTAQTAAPYVVGQIIHVSGATSTTGTINGVQIVLSSTTTTTTFATTATGTVSGTVVLAQPKKYGVTLTGGSITINNNINFLTPEVLGVVNVPLGHVTGTRSVSGSFTCYLDEATNGSIDLYQDLLNATTTVTNRFQLQFFVGGKGSTAGYPGSPGVMLDMGQCHLEIPTINIDDVIGFEVNFTALPSNISGTDELQKIRYVS